MFNSNCTNQLIDHLPYSIFLCSINGEIIWANKSVEKLLNTKLSNLENKNIKNFIKNHHEIFYEDISLTSNKQNAFFFEKEIEFKNIPPTKYKFSKTIMDGNILIVIHTSDEELQLENAKQTFVTTLVHDLKSPTNAQIQAINLLINQTFGDINNSQKDILTQLKTSCQYMNTLISNIIHTYFCETQYLKLHYENFDIIELINKCIENISVLLKEKEQKIIFKSDKNKIIINADYFQLKRVILNLLSNSIKYGFINSEILINISEKDKKIGFTITNNSPFISQEEITNIFEKYKTTGNKKFNNTNYSLGLYLSKEIIKAHKGKIYAKSYNNNKCTFEFQIPLIKNQKILNEKTKQNH